MPLNSVDYVIFRYQPPENRVDVTTEIEKKTRGSQEKTITWTNQPGPRNDFHRPGRRPSSSILRPDAGTVTGRAKDLQKEIDCFELFLSTEIQEIILHETNKKIADFNQLHQREDMSTKFLPEVTVLNFDM